MSLFKKIGRLFSGGSSKDLAAQEERAFKRQLKVIKESRKRERAEARFAATEGSGIARAADFELGDEETFDGLSDLEEAERSTGRLSSEDVDTGLIL